MTVMTETAVQALRRAAVRATLAPSVHNTQPWRFVLTGDALEVHADQSRRLWVLDPTGRQLHISLGCALLNARVSLAAAGLPVTVDRFCEPLHTTLVARVRVDDRADVPDALGGLDSVIPLRHTNRRRFAHGGVPADVVDSVQDAARREDSTLLQIVDAADRIETAVLCQRADALENADPAYRAELRAWTGGDPGRGDGIDPSVVPGRGLSRDEIPIRDFDTAAGVLPAETRSGMDQCLLVLTAPADHRENWLRAGEALQRVLLEVTRQGYVAGLMTQVIEIGATRALLRAQLRTSSEPQVLLRVGRAPVTPATRRRRLVDVLSAG